MAFFIFQSNNFKKNIFLITIMQLINSNHPKNYPKNEHFLPPDTQELFVFRKIWRALFSWNTRFEIRPFALLLVTTLILFNLSAQNLLIIIFHILSSFNYIQLNIITPLVFFVNKTMISCEYPLWNVKYPIFIIVSPTDICKSFPLCFIFSEINSFPNPSVCL